MSTGKIPGPFNSQRGVSFLPRNKTADGFKAFQEAERRAEAEAADSRLTSEERFEKIRRRQK